MTGKTFDIGDSIFFFFKRVGANPLGAVWIAACQMAVVAALAALAFMLLGPFYGGLFELVSLENSGGLTKEESSRQVLSLIGPFIASIPLIGLSGMLAALMFQAAWLRFLTRGEIAAGIPFRLGGDEFRLLGVNLLYLVVSMAASFGLGIVSLVTGLASAGVLVGTDGSLAGGLMTALMVLVAVIAVGVIVLVVAIRLASAPALTMIDRRMRFFESWTASQGVFWNLALSYLVVIGLVLVLSSVLSTLIGLIFLGALIPVIFEFVQLAESQPDLMPQDVIDLFQGALSNPGVVIGLVIALVLAYAMQLCFEGMWHGVAAYNAVRYRADGAAEETDAPVLAADHPAGASPREG